MIGEIMSILEKTVAKSAVSNYLTLTYIINVLKENV